MAKQGSTRAQAWRLRREAYLRAAGRTEDLVCEGFERGSATMKWTVAQGGRRESVREPEPGRLVLVPPRNPSAVNEKERGDEDHHSNH
jgi:hypothetical protein